MMVNPNDMSSTKVIRLLARNERLFDLRDAAVVHGLGRAPSFRPTFRCSETVAIAIAMKKKQPAKKKTANKFVFVMLVVRKMSYGNYGKLLWN